MLRIFLTLNFEQWIFWWKFWIRISEHVE